MHSRDISERLYIIEFFYICILYICIIYNVTALHIHILLCTYDFLCQTKKCNEGTKMTNAKIVDKNCTIKKNESDLKVVDKNNIREHESRIAALKKQVIIYYILLILFMI